MELEKLKEGLSDPQKLIDSIQKSKPKIDYEKYKNEYDPLLHEVITNKTGKYPDKIVNTEAPDGTKIQKQVAVTRIAFPAQEMIVGLRAIFLCGNPIELSAIAEKDSKEDKLIKVIKKMWDDNKLDYESKGLAKILMSETDCAELWFAEEAKKGYWKGTANEKLQKAARLRLKILSNSNGDGLYPVYNRMGDMIAFCRSWTFEEGDTKEEHFDIYLDEIVHTGVKKDNEWKFEAVKHGFNKIPVIYYSQKKPEWYAVQPAIERLEISASKHGNANDYMGYPLMAVYGKIGRFADKGDEGKVIEIEPGGKLEMVVWPQAPESVKLEQERLIDWIHTPTGTPKLSGEDLTSAGNYSGYAMELRFLPALMKAAEKEEIFGKGIQRRINLLKSAAVTINSDFEEVELLEIKPKFNLYTPKNTQEIVNMLINASGGKEIMSQQTAIELNPLIEDKEGEKTRVDDEKKAADTAQQQLNSSPGGLDSQMNNPLNAVA
jgi:SPP1 family phage portal protein